MEEGRLPNVTILPRIKSYGFPQVEKSETVAEVSASQPNRQQKGWEAGLLRHGDFHKTSWHEQKSF